MFNPGVSHKWWRKYLDHTTWTIAMTPTPLLLIQNERPLVLTMHVSVSIFDRPPHTCNTEQQAWKVQRAWPMSSYALLPELQNMGRDFGAHRTEQLLLDTLHRKQCTAGPSVDVHDSLSSNSGCSRTLRHLISFQVITWSASIPWKASFWILCGNPLNHEAMLS